MSTIGYARVSSIGQSLEIQEDQLRAAGCERIFAEKQSGTSTDGRDQLAMALDYVRDGDVLVVTRLDRLARSVSDLRKVIDRLASKGVGFRAVQQGAVDSTTSNGKLLLNILASFAEFETDLRKERQAEGIAKAKLKGIYRGRPKTINAAEVARLSAEGLGATAIAKRLGVSRASVYRVSEG